jgi:flavorubredoxin
MVEKRALTLYWSKNGNTEKVARRIHDTLRKGGIDDSILRVTRELEVEYLDYNLVFLGAPVYENLPPKPVIEFLKRQRKRGVDIIASAPEKPGIAAVPFCTYGGGHTGYREAVPMLKYIGQFFEHEGIGVVEDIAVTGVFPEADESYNTKGRFGIITDRPSAQDLREVEGRVLGVLRRLHLVLPLGEGFL